MQYRQSESDVWTKSAETDPTDRSITITDLNPGAQYEVRVLAVSKFRDEVDIGSLSQRVRSLEGKCTCFLKLKVYRL